MLRGMVMRIFRFFFVDRPARSPSSAPSCWRAATAYYVGQIPDLDELLDPREGGSVTLLDTSGQTFAWRGQQLGLTTAERVSPHLDQRHHRHRGPPLLLAFRGRPAAAPRGRSSSTCAPARPCRAARRSPSRWRSSIWFDNSRTLERKIKEIPAALALEWKFSKNEILSIYLNRAYLGASATGFEAASERYFGKSAADVTPAEAAMLAGLLRAPSRFAPTNDLARAQERAKTIVGLMEDQGYLTAAQAARGARPPGGALGRGGGARRRRLRRLGDGLGAGLPDPADHRGRRGRDHLRPAHPAGGRGGARRGLRRPSSRRARTPRRRSW